MVASQQTSTTSPAQREETPPQREWLEGFDIVCLLYSPKWMSLRSVPEYTMTRLAKANRVLIVEPFGSLPTLLREAKIQNRKRNTDSGLRQEGDNLWIYSPPPWGLPFHTRARWITRANNAIEAWLIRRQIKRLGFKNILIWSYLYNTAGVLKGVPARLRVYECIDNDAALARNEFHRRLTISHDTDTCRAADLVMACSEALAKDHAAFNCHEVYCATDPAVFAKAMDPALPMPEDLRGMKGPIIGYMGGVDTVKLDIEMIRAIALARPQYSFAFVGFIWFGFDRTVFDDLPNVHLLGSKPSEQIPAYLHHMRVCIAPFAINDTTRYGDSLKIYEYLSAGKPVVSTHIPSALRVGAPVRLAATAEEFVAQIDAALEEDDSHLPARLAAVRGNTWDHRVAEKSRYVREYLARTASRNPEARK